MYVRAARRSPEIHEPFECKRPS